MIAQFRGEYRFLSNFYPATVIYQGRNYATVEHAYQAAKCVRQTDAANISAAATPGAAKRMGRLVEMRADWEDIKLAVMGDLLLRKFSPWNPHLLRALLATEYEVLVEGNTWGDTYWGMSLDPSGALTVGLNHLGDLLMEVRDYRRLQSEAADA